jgi:hypothetical protein
MRSLRSVSERRLKLEEQQREDVGLEVGRIDRTTQNIGRLPKMPGESSGIQID